MEGEEAKEGRREREGEEKKKRRKEGRVRKKEQTCNTPTTALLLLCIKIVAPGSMRSLSTKESNGT